jgi:Asp-tRNA(Asn)/Glu-tRNA(Gln) amidotransferase A subunit family amidase
VHAWESFYPDRITLGRLSVGVKDVINTADFPTEMGSEIWKGFTPGNDARVVSKLREAGCVIVGKTVSAEFAVHHPGPTRNPHHLARTPGTSSSGSAVAVACGMVPAALGTQTAGSIIRPASYCGVYAMKPSFGLIPRTGILKTADTLDTVGFFAENPALLGLLLDICRVDGPDYPQTEHLKRPSKIKKIGLIRPSCQSEWPLYALEALDHWILRLNEFLTVDESPWPLEDCYRTHRTIYHKSLSYYFQNEATTGKVSDIFQKQVEEGRQITPGQYQEALRRQEDLSTLADGLLKKFDILITLSSGGEAPMDEGQAPRDTCLVWTMCGVPVINIPALVSPDGLPFGISIIARRFHDYKLLDFLNTLVKAGLAPTGPNPLL